MQYPNQHVYENHVLPVANYRGNKNSEFPKKSLIQFKLKHFGINAKLLSKNEKS